MQENRMYLCTHNVKPDSVIICNKPFSTPLNPTTATLICFMLGAYF